MDATCAMCQRIISSDGETGDLEGISICGDCKFLFLEDIGTPIHVARRRLRRVRRRRGYWNSGSVENIFSQQFSSIINLARQSSQPPVSEHDTTPSGSSRRLRVLSDTESDGIDSFHGESDSNVSFSAYRYFHGESDTVSFSAYGGWDSDASVDAHSLLDNDIFGHQHGGSDLDSDTDIDPMHAGGGSRWNSDDQEEEDEDNEWDEADGENVADTIVRDTRRQFHVPRFEGTVRLGFRDTRVQGHIPSIFANLAESELQVYARNSGDYLDARGFEELLEHLAESDNSRRGAPPAAVSFVNSLPRVIINEGHSKQDSLTCAICKEFLAMGTTVNQLPCFHLYHPSCILPWLSSRNTCPLCRYELPTDDKDYEDCKQRSRNGVQEIVQHELNDEESFSETSDGVEEDEACEFSHVADGGESRRGRWLYIAAPIVSLVGIVLVLWLRNPVTGRPTELCFQGQHLDQSSVLCPPNRRENRSRRWLSLF